MMVPIVLDAPQLRDFIGVGSYKGVLPSEREMVEGLGHKGIFQTVNCKALFLFPFLDPGTISKAYLGRASGQEYLQTY